MRFYLILALLSIFTASAWGHESILARVYATRADHRFETEDLILRQFEAGKDDISIVDYLYWDMPEVWRVKHFNNSVAGCAEYFGKGAFASTAAGWACERLPILIQDKKTSAIVGALQMIEWDDSGRVEFGYGIKPEFRGQGFATKAVRKMIELVREVEPNAVFQALTEPKNKVSRKVLTKTGFQMDHLEKARNLCWYFLLPKEEASAATPGRRP